jgi:L-alanine-DL-glutamate epimerase-like enolase superfamily enzyme
MKIAAMEVLPVSVPYRRSEQSSVIDRKGVTAILVKLTADNGLIGWGECAKAASAATVIGALDAMQPFVVGSDPWNKDALALDLFNHGLWRCQPMTGNGALAGIDAALWDICGKQAGQPVYRFFGGAMRSEVDYHYYLHWADAAGMAAQGRDGVERGYSIFYMKAGVDEAAEEAMLAALRKAIGSGKRIRIDPNEAWTVPQAVRLANDWHRKFEIEFIEAPVRSEPADAMLDVKQRIPVPLCANEGLWRDVDVLRMIRSRAADYLCFSPVFVGTLRRFNTLAHLAHYDGMLVCKHTRGELGLSAAVSQHMMLAIPNACDGNQQNAQILADDILAERIPISEGPRWGLLDRPGLGVEVDEDKVRSYRDRFLDDGEFVPHTRKGHA